jgi:membrane protease YdiL (CAAX protease family)
VVAALTLVAGMAALGATLAVPADSRAFGLLGLMTAGIWAAGSMSGGPVDLPGQQERGHGARLVAAATALGGAAYLAFWAASVVAGHVPLLGGGVDSALDTAEAGPLAVVVIVAVLNAGAEECFFRGALPLALGGDHAPVLATGLYVVATVATLNVALVVAAAVMGTVFMLERLATGGLLAPTLTHVTWSLLMVLALPG